MFDSDTRAFRWTTNNLKYVKHDAGHLKNFSLRDRDKACYVHDAEEDIKGRTIANNRVSIVLELSCSDCDK